MHKRSKLMVAALALALTCLTVGAPVTARADDTPAVTPNGPGHGTIGNG